jgi:ubiquitin C-terminal hydrolase
LKNKFLKIILQLFFTITGIIYISSLVVNAAPVILPDKPRGLYNLGNTCYMNAPLQALLNNEELVDYLLNAPESDINRTNRLGSGGEVFDAFKELCQERVRGTETPYRPDKFKQAFGKFNAMFSDYGQHDAQECLMSILDALHEDLNQSDVTRGIISRADANNTLSGMDLHHACNKSPIVDMFHSTHHESLACPQCHYVSQKKAAVAIWGIPVGPTLYDCADLYCQSEQLSLGNEWECDNCGRRVLATKTTSIDKFAPCVAIHLRRFTNTPAGMTKNNTPVTYPLEFDASRYDKDAGIYELESVICHSGTMAGGHYICYVKNGNQWFLCNDALVTTVSETQVLSQTQGAYVFMYSEKKPVNNQTTATTPAKPIITATPPAAPTITATPPATPLTTATPPAPVKPVITPKPVVVKPVSPVSTVPVRMPTFSLSSGIPDEEILEVFRVYNPNNGMHHYTMNRAEVDHLISIGWQYEGVAFKCSANGMPVYRLYNPNDGTHHYTMDENERDNLVALGWNYEGIAWYALMQGEVPVFRMYNPGNGEHVWTTNYAEVENAVAHGWRYEGIAWYIQ